MVSLLQWHEFLRLGAKFHIPVAKPAVDAQSWSIRWLRERCALQASEDYARAAEVLRWYLGPEYVLFSIASHGTKEQLHHACLAGHQPKVRAGDAVELGIQDDANRFYDLFAALHRDTSVVTTHR